MPFSCPSVCEPSPQTSFVYQSTNIVKYRKTLTSAVRTVLIVISTSISVSAMAQDRDAAYKNFSDDAFITSRANELLISNELINNQATVQKTPKAQIDWDVMATAYSPAQPITAFIKDWDAPLDSGKLAYVQGRAALNVRPAGSAISYGLGWRYDYLMSFNQETANLYWQYQNKQLPNQNQIYPLQLEAKHNERIGANVGFTQQLVPNWQLTTYANIWQGLHVLEGNAKGSLIAQAVPSDQIIRNIDRLNSIETNLNYYYDKPALGEEDLNWHPDKPTGYGYSLDLHLTGQLTDKTVLSVRGYDLLGRMHWQDTPNTKYVLDYNTNRRPLDKTEGQLSTNDVTQTLPWRVEGSLTHQVNNQWQLGAHGQANNIQNLYQLSAGYQTSHDTYPVTITGLIEPQTQALGIAIDSKYAGIRLLTDDIDSEKAKRSEISLYGRYEW